jgi:hypothetical protein
MISFPIINISILLYLAIGKDVAKNWFLDEFRQFLYSKKGACAPSCFCLCILHTVPYTQLINNIAIIAGFGVQLFADIGHVDLQLLGTSLVDMAPNIANNGRIGQNLARMYRKER